MLLQAQITVSTDGEVITPGQVFTFNTTTIAAELPFRVKNDTEEPIFLKLRMDNMSNTTGSSVQFCFGVCLYSVTPGLMVPPSFPIEIEPNGLTPNGDHFWNSNPGDGVNYPMVFNLTFVQTTDEGVPMNDLLSFQYRFDPNLSTGSLAELKQMGVDVKNTKVASAIAIETQQPTLLEIFSVNGKLLQHTRIDGAQSVDVSTLASGTYILHFTVNGQVSNVRIIKE